MTDASETHYTRSADGTNLAYQMSGDGPLDLVFMQAAVIPVDLLPEDPGFVRFRKRLATFSRTLWFDSGGWGASEGDPLDSLPGEISDANLAAVLDAVAFDRPVLVAEDVAAGRAIHFSVTRPDRVSALVLVNGYVHYVREDDYPWGVPRESLDRLVLLAKENWGTGAPVEVMAPSRVGDERFRAWLARSARFTSGPNQMAVMARASFEMDVRPLLASVSVPTLVLHRADDRLIHLGAGRYVAEHIPNAKFVALPGEDHMFFVGDTDAVADEIEDFLTGTRSGAAIEAVMAAVLFTDIVASTEHQTRVGQGEWSRITDRHDAMVRAALARHRGHEVKTTGDGFLATFDSTGRALHCAADIVAAAKDMGLELRAGVHAGEVEVRGDDIAGLSVTIARRVCDLATPGEVLVSYAVAGVAAGSGIEFVERGEHRLKGVPGTWRLYRALT
jgi:class 3 adenylate cyclase